MKLSELAGVLAAQAQRVDAETNYSQTMVGATREFIDKLLGAFSGNPVDDTIEPDPVNYMTKEEVEIELNKVRQEYADKEKSLIERFTDKVKALLKPAEVIDDGGSTTSPDNPDPAEGR